MRCQFVKSTVSVENLHISPVIFCDRLAILIRVCHFLGIWNSSFSVCFLYALWVLKDLFKDDEGWNLSESVFWISSNRDDTINLQEISDHMSQLLKANEGFCSFEGLLTMTVARDLSYFLLFFSLSISINVDMVYMFDSLQCAFQIRWNN